MSKMYSGDIHRGKNTVVDLNAGLGGRVVGFANSGFEVIKAFDIDSENCEYLKKIIDPSKVIQADISQIDIHMIPDADVITFKVIQLVLSIAGGKKEINSAFATGVNKSFYDVIKAKRPKCVMIEFPRSTVKREKERVEAYLKEFNKLGYEFEYAFCNESDYSGFPVNGSQAFFAGVLGEGEVKFPSPSELKICPRKIIYDSKIDFRYRTLDERFGSGSIGKWYVKEREGFKETEKIHMGGFKVTYVVDEWGLRKLTHNELARIKGLTQGDYNTSQSMVGMYYKIAYASNVYVVEAISEGILNWLNQYKDEAKTIHTGAKGGKTVQENIIPKLTLEKVYIEKLKGLNNIGIDFREDGLTAIMGVNGAGKSTILHALACTYSSFKEGDSYRFSYFFTPSSDDSWKGSSIEVTNRDASSGEVETRIYKKNNDRWARYNKRPKRDLFFFGIDSCVPDIEKESSVSFINFTESEDFGRNSDKILSDAAYILQRDYKEISQKKAGKKKYIGISSSEVGKYSSLSMGAGEQKVIKLLSRAYGAYPYSLILVDEIDLLLHPSALNRLIKKLADIAEHRHLQIIFTTHSLEMRRLERYIDIRYLEHKEGKIIVYNTIKPDLEYELCGEAPKDYTVYVEDDFAAAIVRKVLNKEKMMKYTRIVRMGSINNAFAVAASKVTDGRNNESTLIVTDGDEAREVEKRKKKLDRFWSGSEPNRDRKVDIALGMITQFNPPNGENPEKFIHSLLVKADDTDDYTEFAKGIIASDDKHDWINKIVNEFGDKGEVYSAVINKVSETDEWKAYVADVQKWAEMRKKTIS